MEKKSPSLRFVLFAFIGATVLGLSPSGAAEPPPDPKSKLVVHEWGVLTVGHPGGTPILGAADRYLESLPKFVLRNDLRAASRLSQQQQNLMVWKPVIHLYGEEGQKIEVSVRVAGGFPIVFYPKPKLAGLSTNTGRAPITWHQVMTWNFSLTKKRPTSLLSPPTDHWWNAARNIPGDFVVMDDKSGSERFLFYEGTTKEKPSINAAVSEKSIVVTNGDSVTSAPVILIRNDHGSRSGVYLEPIAAGKTATLSPESFTPWDDETLFTLCRKQWEACGMTREEAIGIVESWRPELLNTPGFLLICRIPEPVYERMFPIDIKPAPAELTRACLVFDTLSGQHDRKHWLPRLSKAGRAAFADLAEAEFKRRLEAQAKILAWGEVMVPFAEEILSGESLDPQLEMATSTLMGVLTESPVCNNALPPMSFPQSFRGGFVPVPDLIEGPVPSFDLPPKFGSEPILP